ncbi:calcium-binding protein [Brevundimonas sp.]|uniref:calcium-binding protein n=1 Tax=Brevundimonas sp. TaxID=1871086 RepID=UPI003BA92582
MSSKKLLAETITGTSGDDFIYGGDGDEHLIGGAGNDTLMPGYGADVVDGGSGNDLIVVEEDWSIDILTGGTGADTFQFTNYGYSSTLAFTDRVTDFSQSSGDRIDLQETNIRWGGEITTGGFALTEGAVLPGISNDLVTAWTWVTGGISYLIVDRNRNNRLEATDLVVQFDNGAVITAAAFVSGAISTIIFGTAGPDTWIGTSLAEEYRGYGGDDSISGGGGDDILDGGDGNDTIRGDAGDDILIGDVGDDVLYGGAGNDTLYAAFRYNSSRTDFGHSNLLYGEAGDDILIAGRGLDVLEGGSGDDLLDSRDDDAETGPDILRGGDGDDLIIANGDWVDGGAGDDEIRVASGYYASGSSVAGGSGADLFDCHPEANFARQSFSLIRDFNLFEGDRIRLGVFGPTPLVLRGALDNPGFSLTSGATFSASDYGPGFTQIWTWVNGGLTYLIIDLDQDSRLGAADYVLTFEGTVTITADFFESGTLATPNIGTSGDDVFVGAAGADIYAGVNGNDTISGGPGDDVLQGNNGNDLIDGGSGDDTLEGGNGDDTIYGGKGDDVITGGSGSDLIYGGTGNDRISAGGNRANDADATNAINIIYGEAGDDQISGGWSRNDQFHGGDGDDYIYGSGHLWGDAGNDNLGAAGWASTLDGGVGDDYLHGSMEADILIGGDGNDDLHGGDGDDELTGGSGNDFLSGDEGADRMSGGAGDDTYYVDQAGDQVIEAQGEGVDTVYSDVSFSLLGQYAENLHLGYYAVWGKGNDLANMLSGNTKDNVLTGFGGNDVLNGWDGKDRMIGGLGDDTYYVDNVGDVVVEVSGEGVDLVYSTVTYSLAGQYVEKLTLTGTDAINATGNTLANILVGNAAANVINGGKGADTMAGGEGADTYYVDDVADRVIEADEFGIDLIYSTVSYSLAGQYVEKLTLTGSAAINATGNTQANTIVGNTAANVINGGKGADTLIGGKGADIYYVDNIGDKVIEAKETGVDLVYSTVTYSLAGQYVENLTLTGSAAINATGNTLNNLIIGNSGANVISGGAGADTLTGGAGADRFVYASTADSTVSAFDRITDLTNSDRIDLSAIDANTKVAGNQGFSIVDAFTRVAGQMTLDYSATTKLTTILMDVNGDGVADMKIVANGNHEAFNNFVF